jgi:hypothetical protein
MLNHNNLYLEQHLEGLEGLEWVAGWEPGALADRLRLVGDDAALAWAVTEEQVRYVAQVYKRPEIWVTQVMRNRATWRRFFNNL